VADVDRRRRIAFTCRRGSASTVFVAGVDDGDQREVDPSGAQEANPTWSSDGGSLAYDRTDMSKRFGAPGRREVWAVRVRQGSVGEHRALLAGDRAFVAPAWSPVANVIAATQLDERTLEAWLVILDVGTGRVDRHRLAGVGAVGPSSGRTPWRRPALLVDRRRRRPDEGDGRCVATRSTRLRTVMVARLPAPRLRPRRPPSERPQRDGGDTVGARSHRGSGRAHLRRHGPPGALTPAAGAQVFHSLRRYLRQRPLARQRELPP
jgi:hypothetical protein